MPSRPGNQTNKRTRRATPRRVLAFVDHRQQPLDDSDEARSRYYKEFGRRLKDARASADVSQTVVADFVGIDRSYLSQIEDGERHMSLNIAHAMAFYFGHQLDDLLSAPVRDKTHRQAVKAKR